MLANISTSEVEILAQFVMGKGVLFSMINMKSMANNENRR